MRNWSMQKKIYLLVVVPAAVITAIVICISTARQISRLNDNQQTFAVIQSKQIARASYLAIVTDNSRELRQITSTALESGDLIQGIEILRNDGSVATRAIRSETQEWGLLATLFSPLAKLVDYYSLDNEYSMSIPPQGEGTVFSHFGTPAAELGTVTINLSAQYRQQELATILGRAFLSLLGMLVLILFLAFVARQMTLRSMGNLSKTINELAEGKSPTSGFSDYEGMDGVAKGLSQLTKRLSENQQAVGQLETQNKELLRAQRIAERSARSSSSLLAGMSHELRTPLTAILSHTQMLESSGLSAEQMDMLQTIRRSGQNLLSVINDVIDWSGIEAGKIPINEVGFDLYECVEDTVSLLAPLAYEKDLELTQIIYRDVPTRLRGDPVRLQQIMTNLITNGIKFTSQGSVTVRVMLEEEDVDNTRIRFTVNDTGVGIDVEEQKKLFKEYTQLSAEQLGGLSARGSGLGLAISKRLVGLMGGEIEVSSEPGKGSRFSFILPFNKSRQGEAAPMPWIGLSGRRVRIIDNNNIVRTALAHHMETWGMTVTQQTGLMAIQNRGLPVAAHDIAILGLLSHDVGTPDVVEFLKQNKERGIPVLTLVTSTDEGIHRQLRNAGAAACLPKVSNRLTLYRVLCRLAGVSSQSDERKLQIQDLEVLIADDVEANRRYLKVLAEQVGAQPTLASGGQECLDLWQEHGHPLVLLDVRMPDLDGAAVARRIRDLEVPNQHTIIIGITAALDATLRRHLLDSGMDDCMLKPTDKHSLLRDLKPWILEPPEKFSQEKQEKENAEAASEAAEIRRSAHDVLSANPDLLRLLAESLPGQLETLEQAFRENNLEKAREEIHQLHGTAAFYQLESLKNSAHVLEDDLKKDIKLDVGMLFSIRHAVEDILEELDKSKGA